MKPTLNEQEFEFFANHKETILAALNSAILYSLEHNQTSSKEKYEYMWNELYNITRNGKN